MARIGEGQSGGCRTCRRRKVKCDERHPICERCEKANRACEGYIRDHRFVDENSRTERHVKRKTVSDKPGSLASREVSRSPKSDGNPCRSLGLSGFEGNLYISFLLADLFFGSSLFSPWLQPHIEDRSLSAQMSVQALGAAYFGKMYHLDSITRHGSDIYGKALVSLNRDIQDSEKAWSMSVLRSAITLEVYEFIVFDSDSGWMKHAGGVGSLIQLRGPWRHQDPAERRILEGNRVTIALECLIKRRRCFLEHPDWKFVPWAADPKSKTPVLYLHDILCDIPGLNEDESNLELPNIEAEQQIAKRHDLSRNIFLHLRALYEWRATWQQQNPESCYEIPTSNPIDQSLFPTVLYYTNLFVANEITLYNSILLLLLKLGFRIIGPSFDASVPSLDLPKDINYGPLYPPGRAPNIQAVAREICKSAEYHLLNEAAIAGSFSLLFPLKLAYQIFHPTSREAHWLSEVIKKIAGWTEFGISRNLATKEIVTRTS